MLVVSAAILLSLPALAKDGDPATPAEAMALAKPFVEAAAKARSAESKEITEGLRKALDALKAQSKEGFKQEGAKRWEFESFWNLAVSLGHYHALKPLPEYRLAVEKMDNHPIQFGLPIGRGWVFSAMTPAKGDQLWGEIVRTLPNARMVRKIRFWIYRWDTVYSGVGGENAKGLAEGDFAADREGMTRVTARSARVITARLSRGFPKTSFYEVAGTDDKLGPARRRNYFVKGSSTTFNFEVIEMRKTEPGDDPWTAWQTEAPDPELESFAEVEAKKK
jgi:hypothetical protein